MSSYKIATNNVKQDIGEAITRSISHNEIVILDVSGSGHETTAYEDALARECEGNAENGSVREFWGVQEDEDGCDVEWRVHLVQS